MFRNLSKLNNQLNIIAFNQRNYAKAVNMLGRRTVDTSKSDNETQQAVSTIPEKSENVNVLANIPEEYTQDHVARIYVPTKNSMQSGTYGTKKWKIEFNTNERWQNQLMGWGSTGDAHSNINIEFTTKEDAIVYCERMGYKYEIEDKHTMKLRPKTYSANFSWNKKTRVSNK